jgi:DNA ligase (NAD+)
VKERLIHFGSKGALDIDGLGEKLVDQLVDRGLVEGPADLFELTVEQLVELDRMAKKSAQNLVNAISGSKEDVTLPRLIYGLGIPHVGQAVAADLASEFGSLDDLAAAREEDLVELEGFAETVASAVRQWFDNPKNRELLDRLREHGVWPEARREGDRLEGKTFVITGALGSMTRDEAAEAVRMQGGKVTTSVSGNTDYLVVGSNPGSAKMQDADEHGTQIIDEDEFLELLGRK